MYGASNWQKRRPESPSIYINSNTKVKVITDYLKGKKSRTKLKILREQGDIHMGAMARTESWGRSRTVGTVNPN